MTHEEYTQTKTAIQYATNDIKRMAKDTRLPHELRVLAKHFAKSFEEHVVEKPALEKPTGRTLAGPQVKALLQEHTGYLWKDMSEKEINEREPDGWAELASERLGLDISNKVWRVVGFWRETGNRSELNSAIFLLVPGGWYATYSTGRADSHSEKMRPNAELKSFITQQMAHT